MFVIFLPTGGINYHARGLTQQRIYSALPSQPAMWSEQNHHTDCHHQGVLQAMGGPVGDHQDDPLWRWWARRRTGTMAEGRLVGWRQEVRKLEEFGRVVQILQAWRLWHRLIPNEDQLRSYTVSHVIIREMMISHYCYGRLIRIVEHNILITLQDDQNILKCYAMLCSRIWFLILVGSSLLSRA